MSDLRYSVYFTAKKPRKHKQTKNIREGETRNLLTLQPDQTQSSFGLNILSLIELRPLGLPDKGIQQPKKKSFNIFTKFKYPLTLVPETILTLKKNKLLRTTAHSIN